MYISLSLTTSQKYITAVFFSITLLAGCSTEDTTATSTTTTVKDGTVVNTAALVSLGEKLYRDTNLSNDGVSGTQSCATCHDTSTGFDDPLNTATSLGADGVSIGSRNAPTASYAAHIPDKQTITPVPGGSTILGGQFLDGRADSLEEQAKGPFLNSVEMNNTSKAAVISTIKLATYAQEFEDLFGLAILDDVDKSYDYVADAIASFERSETFSPFTSRFDQEAAGTITFTAAEQRGRNLFNGKADCDRCHETVNGGAEVFSDFQYRNIGVPANTALEATLSGPINDLGLGAITGQATDNGRFRTSSLRNIAITAPYMHNGVFSTLTEVVEFYNTRDASGFPPATAEVTTNIDNAGNIGELGLTTNEISDLVAFMETFTDQ